MVQQQQVVCSDCRGQGRIINESDRCRECRGNKTVKDRKVLEVNIEKGMRHGQKITFHGEADEAPGTLPGDVVFVVQQRKHETFQRKGAHLIVKQTISLAQALCGLDMTLTHLDDRVLRVRTQPGEIIKNDMIKMVPNEGMPIDGDPFHRGRLFIQFEVEFPEDGAFSDAQVQALLAVFPERPAPTLSGEEEDVELMTFEPSMLEDERGASQAYDSDEDGAHGGGGQRVQCANQ